MNLMPAVSQEDLLELFFSQSLDGFFFMMLDAGVHWDEHTDKDACLEYVFDHQRLTKVNDALLAQYGAARGELLGRIPRELFAHDVAYGKALWRRLFDQGRLHVDTDERKLDGTPMWVEGDYICLYDPEQRIVGHFGIQREVTE
ncbi:MAG: PAS domain-containing protein, partial [Spirochaetales bacterium]|nr:PAS domain-containing protein [Spirochaetales bacterium]